MPKNVLVILIVLLSLVALLLAVRLAVLLGRRRAPKEGGKLSRLLLSETLCGASAAKKIAYCGVVAALLIVVNLFEFKFADVQFSFTVFASVLAGILIGPALGFVAVFVGDFIGFVVNSWGFLYMPWVGVSCAVMALLAGFIMKLPLRFRGGTYVKLAIVCVAVLVVCTVGINTTGFYLYYTRVGFSERALALLEEHFHANGYLAYALVRLLFMGQLWNSLANYALLFAVVPILKAAKPLKIKI